MVYNNNRKRKEMTLVNTAYFQNKEHGYILSHAKMVEEICAKYGKTSNDWKEHYTLIGSHE